MYEISNQIENQTYENLQVQIVVKTPKYDILSISLEKDAVFFQSTVLLLMLNLLF